MSADSDKHILLSVLGLAARLAPRMGVPLSELKKTAELAYYREARGRGMKMREMSDVMSVWMAKVGALSKDLKQHFPEPEREYSVPRRVLSLLWVGPLSSKRIQQGDPDVDPDVVDAAVETLRRDERIARLPGRTARFELTAHAHRLVQDGWMERIDELGHMMRTAAHVVEGRFSRNDARAFSRSIGFRAIPARLERLRSVDEEHVYPAIAAADEEAAGREDAEHHALTFQFTPDFDESE